MPTLISICIPAYKRIDFLKRLLDSISIQTFTNFEVIVTDDSSDKEVEELCNIYKPDFNICYYRNAPSLGTPENWNEAIRKAKGEWIKLMHDDDWFNHAKSLSCFAEAIEKNPGASFFFSAYRNVCIDDHKEEDVFVGEYRYKMLVQNPVTVYAQNIIGPPSVVMHRNDHAFFYDRNLKWLVDIDFYIRYLRGNKPVYINEALINVGLSKQQVTRETFRVKKVEIPENFYFLKKIGTAELKNIYVYDAWWRFMRNLEIRNVQDISEGGYHEPVPKILSDILLFQSKIPLSLLKVGLLSKLFMLISFIRYSKKFSYLLSSAAHI